MTLERTIHQALDFLWATEGKVTPERFAIAVDYVGWEELGGRDTTTEMTITVRGQEFFILPLEGVPEGTVALVWRNDQDEDGDRILQN